MSLKLTVIDQTPIHEARTSVTAAATSLELAIACESLGYHRYWVAEHHNSIQFAGAAPEILLTRIASATTRMRVGSGGVMLTHYSPYKVAETFALIGGLFPGRIDLGIGRAPGGSHLSSIALAAPGSVLQHDHFPRQAAELCAFLRGDFPTNHAYSALACDTSPATLPSLWMLGSGGGSSTLAGQLGMGLALAKFIAPATCSPAIFRQHAEAYRQSGITTPPPRLVALAVICAASDDEARFLAGTAVYRKLMAGSMPREPLLSPGEVQRRYARMTQQERVEFDNTLGDMVVGSPETCWSRIRHIADEYGCEEIGVVTVTYSFDDRLRSYRLLSEASGLGAR
ncbi:MULTISPECIES: MsnO8 family LLM class oxidoreductase [unclassified Pseudomonas]|uniref:MsnO8 family LLM class oxidoreductase n=1 Tax=unclassified Pseudomonas TaxID=196821 RepID=UPI00135C2030|nr:MULTISPECIES: MsnO8 family LLM class oxidoreductase [unclassified Pseudomonas]MCU1722642.1 MsnO8 family LLM class oxidoreductase [Pseudomonas sp. 5P_5.1_Bac1]